MMMNNHSGAQQYSARMRSRSKQPIYTSDKRAKFTQRENKKWIRLATVIGYVICVSLPAIALSIYYVYMWDPGYIRKFPPMEPLVNSTSVHKSPILPARDARAVQVEATPPAPSCACDKSDQAQSQSQPTPPPLEAILQKNADIKGISSEAPEYSNEVVS